MDLSYVIKNDTGWVSYSQLWALRFLDIKTRRNGSSLGTDFQVHSRGEPTVDMNSGEEERYEKRGAALGASEGTRLPPDFS